MKKILLPFVLLLLFSCQEDGQKQGSITVDASEKPVTETSVSEVPATEKAEKVETTKSDLLGTYVGPFEAATYGKGGKATTVNRITISLNRMDEKKVFGHSVVAGNIRPFEGTYSKKEDGSYFMEVKEPGDDRYDGLFRFSLFPDREKSLEGEWIANDKNLSVNARTYKLEKRDFAYNADVDLPEKVTWDGLYDTWKGEEAESLTDGVLVNASNKELKKEEVENLYKADLEFIRNAIYARHGYSFKNRRVRYVFDGYVDWYMPVSTDIRDQLTDLEKQNIELIKRYEQHATEYYDSFGR